MDVIVGNDGEIRMIYNEDFDLSGVGKTSISRASFVEPLSGTKLWQADMAPSGGPILGPFESRSSAIDAEIKWLSENNLPRVGA